MLLGPVLEADEERAELEDEEPTELEAEEDMAEEDDIAEEEDMTEEDEAIEDEEERVTVDMVVADMELELEGIPHVPKVESQPAPQ